MNKEQKRILVEFPYPDNLITIVNIHWYLYKNAPIPNEEIDEKLIMDAFSCLPRSVTDRTIEIILDGFKNQMSLEEIGVKYDIKPDTVNNMFNTILHELRNTILFLFKYHSLGTSINIRDIDYEIYLKIQKSKKIHLLSY